MKKTQLAFNTHFIQELWSVLKPYWVSDEKWLAFLLLIMNIFCILVWVRASIAFNQFNRDFFNALQLADKTLLLSCLKNLLFIITAFVISLGLNTYFTGLLSLRWRKWLTKYYVLNWLAQASCQAHDIDNPDQRISEDLAKFPSLTLSLFQNFLRSLLMLSTFSVILWHLSVNLSFPGYLFWIAILYAGLGTKINTWIGRYLPHLDNQQQRYNADFRYQLIKLRKKDLIGHPQGVAIREVFEQPFEAVFKNSLHIISVQTRLEFFNKSYNFFSYLLGLCISIPMFLRHTITLGVVTQISGAFNSVVSSFSIFIDTFNELAEWRAVVHRVTGLNQFLTPPLATIDIALTHAQNS